MLRKNYAIVTMPLHGNKIPKVRCGNRRLLCRLDAALYPLNAGTDSDLERNPPCLPPRSASGEAVALTVTDANLLF